MGVAARDRGLEVGVPLALRALDAVEIEAAVDDPPDARVARGKAVLAHGPGAPAAIAWRKGFGLGGEAVARRGRGEAPDGAIPAMLVGRRAGDCAGVGEVGDRIVA